MNHFRRSKAPIAEGSSTVIINHMPAARVTSKLVCGAEILEGIENVYIGGATVQQQPNLPQAPTAQAIAFVNGVLQTQDDSWGAWLERVQNLLTGNGWRTDREVELDKSREFEAKRREAYAWLKAHGATDKQLGKLTAQQQIDVYEAGKRGESSVKSGEKVINIQPGRPALEDDPYHPGNVANRQNNDLAKLREVMQSERREAERLGFNRVAKDPPFKTHGQKAYTDGVRYISRDVDSHSGGVWKMFDRRGNRLGTYDANLNRIGN